MNLPSYRFTSTGYELPKIILHEITICHAHSWNSLMDTSPLNNISDENACTLDLTFTFWVVSTSSRLLKCTHSLLSLITALRRIASSKA
jgi:hypothetical protein